MLGWIGISTSALDTKETAALAQVLECSPHEALGLIVALTGRLAEHQPDGRIADVDDGLVEQWAQWRADRGRFARAVRAVLTGPDGTLAGWRESAGKLLARREAEAKRKRKARVRGPSARHPQPIRKKSVGRPGREKEASAYADAIASARVRDSSAARRGDAASPPPRRGPSPPVDPDAPLCGECGTRSLGSRNGRAAILHTSDCPEFDPVVIPDSSAPPLLLNNGDYLKANEQS